MAFGTDEQKKFYLPKIASGDLHFSIGYSEPGAGTDLAALRTTAVRDGDDYVINGQKMWTSLIHVRRLRVAGGAHQPRGEEAPGHLDADRAHRRARLLLDPGAHDGRCGHQRHLLPGRAGSRGQPGRRGERRLEAGHQPAQPRTRRAGVGPADLRGAQRRSRMGAEHQGCARVAADRLRVGAAEPGAGARQGRGAQADQLGAGVVEPTRPRHRRTPRRPRCSAPSWPPRPTGC